MTASLWEETSTLLRNRFGTADTPSSLRGPFRILYYYYTTAKFPRELSTMRVFGIIIVLWKSHVVYMQDLCLISVFRFLLYVST